MALGTFVAGRYSATWNAVSLGITRQGFELDIDYKHEQIDESDAYGQSLIESIVRGASVSLSATLKEYASGSKAVLWPLGNSVLGVIQSTANPIGTLASDLAKSLVLTAAANTPAAAAPATLTASKAYIHPTYNPKLLFDSRLREVPIRMQFYPSETTGTVTVFTTT